MNAMLILIIAAACLIVGYLTYGRWLAKQWGVDPNRPTPAHELEDGVDYVPAPPYVVLGHHFSSIAGAGPINGPIQAAVFGWVPVLLWVVIGGIFFGAMHDFGALFASLRHKGQTLAAVVAKNIDNTAKRLFCVFAYLTLVLVVAAFASIVANTFAVVPTTGLEGEAQDVHHAVGGIRQGIDPSAELLHRHEAEAAEEVQGRLRRESAEGGQGEVRRLAVVVFGRGAGVGEIAAAVAGGEELAPHALLPLEKGHAARGILRRGERGHHAGGPGADDDDLFHSNPSSFSAPLQGELSAPRAD